MIRLEKNKIIHINADNEEKEVIGLQPYFSELVQLDKNFTLGDLFFFIEKEKEFFNLVFASQLGHYPLDLFIEEYKKSIPETNWSDNEMKFLQLSWICEICNDGDTEFDLGFDGVGEDGQRYAIEFTPLNELKKYPLQIKENFDIYREGSNKRIVCGIRLPTVYELIGAVLFEISFVGSPEIRDTAWNELEAEIKGGNLKTFTSLNDLIDELGKDEDDDDKEGEGS
jgi:hypothetical protein